MECKECKYFMSLSNTDECGQGICGFPESMFPVSLANECAFLPKKQELTCADCQRFYDDTGCLGVNENDSPFCSGKLCCGFESIELQNVGSAIINMKAKGVYDKDKIIKLLDDLEECFKKLESAKI